MSTIQGNNFGSESLQKLEDLLDQANFLNEEGAVDEFKDSIVLNQGEVNGNNK